MGGKALSIPSIRMDAPRYNKFLAELQGRLVEFNVDQYFSPVRAYFNKSDYGDCDILCWLPPKKYSAFQSYAMDVFGATQEVRNGPVVSYGVPTDDGLFQLDVIYCHGHQQFAQVYFDFNDLGNLMGRIAHKLGFKYGHDGLWHVLRDPENDSRVIKELLVTDSPLLAMEFLGYSYAAYQRGLFGGFAELEDVFDFVCTSPHFSPEIYLLDNRNAKSRVRDSKRKSYMLFLEYCIKKNPAETNTPWEEAKAYKMDEAMGCFPSFRYEYLLAVSEMEAQQAFRKLYNGDIVRQLTGLTGKELGAFMKWHREIWGDEESHFRAKVGAIMESPGCADWFSTALKDFKEMQE